MPKLTPQDQQKAAQAPEMTTGEFEPLKPGKYLATLLSVDARESAAGNPMWVAEFGELYNADGVRQPGRQWYNLNLPTSPTPPASYTKGAEKWEQYQTMCAVRIRSFFDAFGYSVDSDTDELIGDSVVIRVAQRTIQQGPRAGEVTNSVEGVEKADGFSDVLQPHQPGESDSF